MNDGGPVSTEAMVSGSKSRWIQCAVLGAVCALVVAFYVCAAHSGSMELMSLTAADTYYNLLVQGFRAGQLSLKKEPPAGLALLADPYDPAANAPYRPASNTMHDMSYYKGRLYLYFGVTPALVLFWPYAALTGHYLFHRQAVAIFCSLGFLASVGLLRALWRRYFDEVSVWVVAACALALGLATGMPVLLPRSEVYEVPISCGYMLTMLALGAIWCALHEPVPRKLPVWLLVASVAYGLAVGARPNLLFGAVILLVPVVQAWHDRKPVWALLTAAVVPIALIGLGLMLYNALRFENPFEFGLRYELGPSRMQLDKLRFFSLPYLWFNLRVYFLEPARWTGQFPFVHRIVVPPLPSGRGQIETPYGVLTNIPLAWLALAVPLAWRSRSESACSLLRGFVAAAALVFGIDAFVLCLFRGANFRYEVEFLPTLVLLSVAAILGLERALTGQTVWRRAVRTGWGLLLSFSVAFNLLASVEYQAEARNNMGVHLTQLGRVQEGTRQYQQALRLKPDYPDAHNNLGVILRREGKLDEAIAHYEQALRVKPDFAEAHNNLGTALEQEGRVQEAIEHYLEALRIRPDHAETHYNLGCASGKLGRVEEAIGHYQQALRLKPDFVEAHNNLGTALFNLGRVTEAMEHYEQAVRLKPDFAEAHYNLGFILEQAGRVQEAVGHYELALQFKPDFAAVKDRLAQIRSRLAQLPVVQ